MNYGRSSIYLSLMQIKWRHLICVPRFARKKKKKYSLIFDSGFRYTEIGCCVTI